MTYPQLTFIYGPKGKSEGVDWDALRAARTAQLDDQVARGVDDHETKAYAAEKAGMPAPAPKPKNRDPFANGGRHTGKSPQYDRPGMARMYDEGKTITAIAKHYGCHTQTVRNNLVAANVTFRDDRRKR